MAEPDIGRWYQEHQRIAGPGYKLPTSPPPEYSRAMAPRPPMAGGSFTPGVPRSVGAGPAGLAAQLAMMMGGSSSPDVQRFYEEREQRRRGMQGRRPGDVPEIPPMNMPQLERPMPQGQDQLVEMLSQLIPRKSVNQPGFQQRGFRGAEP